ncbi:MAG: aspartyl/glutamyl-tRNA amidotransferase subunit A [Anaerolineaceae bacterium]|nr:aspartyl/glutamyl-tRNA amidotransferase subunit A [Anaerolineaceae bacterium]
MELFELTAMEQAELVRTGQVTAVGLLEATLEHVRRTEEQVHAFITVCEKEAREKAEEVDRKIASGIPVGVLSGVPYSAKDVFCTRGIQTTGGSGILSGWIPPYSAAVIERMDAADAVLFAKANCDEFAMGSTNETTAYPPVPGNPHDPQRTAGGSSGGSAAAVAAFEGAVSIGSDTGGSVREPAAFCGVVGLKPTYGRISRWGMTAFASSMDTVGPVTRSVKDAALLMNVLAGFDPRDNVTGRVPVPDYTVEAGKGVRGLRIGISPDFSGIPGIGPADPGIMKALENSAEILENAGAEIVRNVPMPNTKYSIPAYFVISRIEAFSNLQRYDGLKYGRVSETEPVDMADLYRNARGEGFGREVKLRLLAGLFLSQKEFYEKYYRRAQRARALIRSDYDRIFDPGGDFRLDVLLTPAAPMQAFRFDRQDIDPALVQYADQFTSPMNFAGVPAVSFPAGVTEEGLPAGVQAVAQDYCEGKILRTALAIEQALKDKSREAV